MNDTNVLNYSPFRREWIVRRRVFEDGQIETSAVRFDRYMKAQNLHLMPRAKRGESESTEDSMLSAAKRAKQQVRLRCKAIGADRMITLTYRENMLDKEKMKRDFDALRRLLGRVQDFQYVAVAEQQKRGAWHLHIAVKGRQNYRVLRSLWLRVVGENNGNVDVRNPNREVGLRHKIASYIGKYIVKNFDEHKLNEKRYWASRGIKIPEAETIAHFIEDSAGHAIVAAYDAATSLGASLVGHQFFWNQDIGYFWMATREGKLSSENGE
ncbi:rolling circle replication-associated protein [Pandoraea sputorum]|uniref:rolling circle replication-associated protein n=1 Tax=Pandoraea sputorum TaxID=93222 RepID=UPI0012587A43|nr:hypothetical protein [Pandoraea sputorum]VVE82358.1 bacteriophage-related protein [Pandoraea sputorum]